MRFFCFDYDPGTPGIPARNKKRMAAAMGGTWAQPEWDTPAGRDLQGWLVDNVLVHARHHAYWGTEQRWVQEFMAYADGVADEARRRRPSQVDAMANEALHERFIGHIVRSGRGRTVARSARRHLSGKRRRDGLPSLSNNPVISMIVSGGERAQPSTPTQAGDIPVAKMVALSAAVTDADGWFANMVVTMAQMGYLTLMRLVELRGVVRSGLVFVTTTGEKLTLAQARRRPTRALRGMLVHVAWRKARQDTDCWIPLSCGVTIERVLGHANNLAKLGYVGDKLFPSRASGSRNAKPSQTNRVGSTSFVKELRKLMVAKRLFTVAEAKKLRGHSLRVGGSNNCRRQGMSADTHRLMGGWASLASSNDYMALTVNEQFNITDAMLGAARTAGIETRQEARRALSAVLPRIG